MASIWRRSEIGKIGPPERLPVAGTVDSLPTFKASHTAGAALVLHKTRRVVVLDWLQRASHRHALDAGT